MKRLSVILNGICTYGLCAGMSCSHLTFVNDSKFTYVIDASEVKNAVLSFDWFPNKNGTYESVIKQAHISPGKYLRTYLHNKNTHIDHGKITIKRDKDVVGVISIKVLEHFKNWKLILDNENCWARFSVNKSMNTVIEEQLRYYGEHFIKIHDYDQRYRYSNQREYLEFWSMNPDGSEDPEPPANEDTRPQIVALPMEDTIIQRDYLKEKYKSEEGGCCLLQ